MLTGILWGGGALLLGAFVIPSVFGAGPAGGAVMGGMAARKVPQFLSVMGLLAALSGIRLYMLMFHGSEVWTAQRIVLTLGGLLAVSALFIGGGRLRPLAMKLAEAAKEGRHAEIPALAARIQKLSMVQAWHIVAIIILMAGHRLASQF